MSAVFPIACILGGCMINNFVLELIVKEDPGIGNLLTAVQFLFIAIIMLPYQLDSSGRRLFKAPKIPIGVYVLLTCIFFALSIINNKAFDYEISQPIHMIFRSSSLLASMLLGLSIFGKRYSSFQVAGVLFVTGGVIAATVAEGAQKTTGSSCGPTGCSGSLSGNGTYCCDFNLAPRQHAPKDVLLLMRTTLP
eukprot:TRINITY_DN8668_c0_g1_i1.p1 TRINITY_DN8668_c0_g1~~TRINITY_DN8668_c0_g1_i1.p1  ORF type:complete len:193 (-),score=4.76 TRINITY_DN8668_c0_g1_i1:65-643(-)